MDGTLSTETLIDYHFGTLADDQRDAVEQTLLTSGEALRAYLGLKRVLDGAAASDDRPAPETKARLRASVMAVVADRSGPRWRQWLARPIPLYQTIAVAAAVAVMAGVFSAWRPPHGQTDQPTPSLSSTPPVDSARALPFSLEVL